MRERTTKKQRELLIYVDAFIKEQGYAPSYREIMRALGYKSVSTVAAHVDNLVQRGYLKKGTSGVRTLEVVPAPSAADDHLSWLRRQLQQKQRALAGDTSAAAESDRAALQRTAELFGLE